jgi:hypothetical protein
MDVKESNYFSSELLKELKLFFTCFRSLHLTTKCLRYESY